MEGKGGPKCSNTGGKIRRTKGELYLKLLQKPKADQKSKRQSSKQEPDKVAKKTSRQSANQKNQSPTQT